MAEKHIPAKIKSYFSASANRQNLESGEEIQTSLSKVKKWFSDLGTAAFTNSTDYAAASHNQAANTITAMTGYSKPQSTSAIAATDTLNEAIGKLEKAVDGAGGGLQPGNVDLSTDSVTLTSSSPTATVTLSNATGDIYIIKDGKGFDASLDNNTITINKPDVFGGNGSVFVIVSGNNTYSAVIKMIAVLSDGPIFCTWAGGTDEEIASMIQAHRDGIIDLTDYWSVDDERVVKNLNPSSSITANKLTLRLGSSKTYYLTTTDIWGNTQTITKESIFSVYVDQERTLASYISSLDQATRVLSCLSATFTDKLIQGRLDTSSYENLKGEVSKAFYGGEYIFTEGISAQQREVQYQNSKQSNYTYYYSNKYHYASSSSSRYNTLYYIGTPESVGTNMTLRAKYSYGNSPSSARILSLLLF